jgi:hypothetical protein
MIQRIAIVYLIAMLFAAWGFAIGRLNVWPAKYINPIAHNISAFLAGHKEEADIGVIKKLSADFGGVPYRFVVEGPARSEGEPVTVPDGMFRERQAPIFHDYGSKGYYLITGAWMFQEENYGVVLLKHDGTIVRAWHDKQPPDISLAITPSGDLLYAAPSIKKVTWCGEKKWQHKKGTHHSIELDPDGNAWTWHNKDLIKVSINNGKILRTVGLKDLEKANTDLGIFDQRWSMDWDIKKDPQKLRPKVGLMDDPYHHNDIDPLPARLADVYPMFKTGDLLVSLRNLNVVMVVDPETLKVKWFDQGHLQRQHDPDWSPHGWISVYDNRPFEKNSQITLLTPGQMGERIAVDGADINWHEPSRGNHQEINWDGRTTFLIVDDRDGRLIHVDEDGNRIFEFQNLLDEDTSLNIRNALWLSDEQVAAWDAACDKELTQ